MDLYRRREKPERFEPTLLVAERGKFEIALCSAIDPMYNTSHADISVEES